MVDGLGLDLTRADVLASMKSRRVVRTDARPYDDGGEEMRFWLADDSFIRLSFPEPSIDAKPSAIVVSASGSAKASEIRAMLERAFGPPTWKSGGAATLLWHARGGDEDAMVPDRDAAFVVELHLLPGQPPSYTLARPSWYSTER